MIFKLARANDCATTAAAAVRIRVAGGVLCGAVLCSKSARCLGDHNNAQWLFPQPRFRPLPTIAGGCCSDLDVESGEGRKERKRERISKLLPLRQKELRCNFRARMKKKLATESPLVNKRDPPHSVRMGTVVADLDLSRGFKAPLLPHII